MSDLDGWSELLAAAVAENNEQPRRICDLLLATLDISGAGISMVTSAGHRGIVCATDDRSARIEELQLTLGVGPCIEALASGAPVLVGDLEESGDVDISRWIALSDDVRTVGVRAVFAFPLRIGVINVGALDLHRDRPGELTPSDLSAALLAADAAALALLHLSTEGGDAFSLNPVTRADYHLQVHQATGMVQVQLGIGTQEALLRLRARAFAEGRSVAELAADVVARRVRFTPEDP